MLWEKQCLRLWPGLFALLSLGILVGLWDAEDRPQKAGGWPISLKDPVVLSFHKSFPSVLRLRGTLSGRKPQMDLPETMHPQQLLYVLVVHCWCVSTRVRCKWNFCKSNPLLEEHLMPFPRCSILLLAWPWLIKIQCYVNPYCLTLESGRYWFVNTHVHLEMSSYVKEYFHKSRRNFWRCMQSLLIGLLCKFEFSYSDEIGVCSVIVPLAFTSTALRWSSERDIEAEAPEYILRFVGIVVCRLGLLYVLGKMQESGRGSQPCLLLCTCLMLYDSATLPSSPLSPEVCLFLLPCKEQISSGCDSESEWVRSLTGWAGGLVREKWGSQNCCSPSPLLWAPVP